MNEELANPPYLSWYSPSPSDIVQLIPAVRVADLEATVHIFLTIPPVTKCNAVLVM